MPVAGSLALLKSLTNCACKKRHQLRLGPFFAVIAPLLATHNPGGFGVRGATLYATNTLYRGGGNSISPTSPAVLAGIAALAIAFAIGLPAVTPGISVSETIEPPNFAPWDSLGLQDADGPGLRLATLATLFESATEDRDWPSEWTTFSQDRASFSKYVAIDPRATSFDERFGGAFDWPSSGQSAESEENANDIPPRSPDLGARAAARNAVRQSPRMAVSTSPPASLSKKQLRVAEALEDSTSPPDADDHTDHTAIYDIAAHTVYLPNGQKLEAHSGLGGHLDNPRYVSEKNWGPTPPNAYDLSLRGELFHGVRALRLTPVGSGNMFGRDGILAHSYMLGPNGQSNGCVSFKDYPVFLNAFLSGQVNRIVVVEHLATAPGSGTAFGWLPDTVRALFVRS
jgi:Protein of unknown function (DUF2778)